LFGSAPASAQEKFTIKLKRDKKGDVTQATEKSTENAKMTVTVMGNPQPKDEDKTVSTTFKEVIIDKEGSKPASKLTRTYQKAEMTVHDKKIVPSFIGKEVLIDRSDKTPKFSVDGKDLEGDDLDFMKEQFKNSDSSRDDDVMDEIMLPKQPVAVGDTWKLDTAALAKEFSKDAKLSIDADKSTAKGKLLKAYQKDGKQFGVFEIETNLALTKLEAGPMPIDLDPTSTMKMTMHFDVCIDGSSHAGSLTMTMESKIAGGLKANGVEVKLDGDIKANSTKTVEDLTGKK
jgi:hypothetical protein